MEKVLITGASGLIGTHLTKLLLHQGYEVHHLVRKPHAGGITTQHPWNPDQKKLHEAVFDGKDHLIHLAGSNIGAGRWTARRKTEIRTSRIDSMQLLFERSRHASLKSVVSASGISIYGTLTSEKIYREDDAAATDFLAQVTVDWEKAAGLFTQRNVRTVTLRTGVVLAPDGGALRKIAAPVQKGFGAVLGSGKQYMPWVHIDDLCRMYLEAIRNPQLHGAYNAVAPEHCTNRKLTEMTASILHKKIRLPAVPEFALKLVFGEMANLILKGSRISSDKIQQTGFVFQYPGLNEALHNCFEARPGKMLR